MKALFITLPSLITTLIFSQIGAIDVKVYKNNTTILADNFEVESITVELQNQNSANDVILAFNAGNGNRFNVEKGMYTVIISCENEKDIILENIEISPDRITFINALIEPIHKLNFFEKRKRKKDYSNY